VGSNLLTVALKDAAGNDATVNSKCQIGFRSTTSNTGTISIDTVQAALSINTNAVGATLGSVNATAFRFWVVAFDNGGTVVLALYNASTATSCQAINEDLVQTSVAMSAGATSAGVYYTPNGTTLTSKAVKILGFVEYNSSGLATAGTYASAPNFISVFGTGAKKPCDEIQKLYFENSTSKNATSASFLDTNLLKAITLTSAANLVHVLANGTIDATVSTTTGQAIVARGAAGGTAKGNMCEVLSNVGAIIAPCAIQAFDKPNTVAATTYVVRIATTDGVSGDAIWNVNSKVTSIIVVEIMG
jgi:hypothetical protein